MKKFSIQGFPFWPRLLKEDALLFAEKRGFSLSEKIVLLHLACIVNLDDLRGFSLYGNCAGSLSSS